MIDRINQLQISKTNMHAGILKKRRGYQAEGREKRARRKRCKAAKQTTECGIFLIIGWEKERTHDPPPHL